MSQQTVGPPKVLNRWLVVFGASLLGLMAGLMYTWSIWVKPIITEYGWNTDQVAMMGNLMLGLFIAGVAIAGQLFPRLGARKVALIGSICFGGFITISAFVKIPVLMLFTYGVMGGIGVGFIYVVGQFTLSAWFPERRGLVLGIFLALFGLSPTVFSAPLNSLIGTIGVQSTMFAMGCMILIVCLVCSIVFMRNAPADRSAQGSTLNEEALLDYENSLTVKEAVKTRQFWQLFIPYTLLVWPFPFISSYMTIFITGQKMLPMAVAVAAVSFCGIGSSGGRLIAGILTDKIGSKLTYFLLCLCSAVSCFALMFTKNGIFLVFLFVIMAIGYGGRSPVIAVIYTQQFGPKYASAIYGYGSIGTGLISGLIAPLTTVAIRRSTGGDFNPAFLLATVVVIFATIVMMTLPKKTPLQKKKEGRGDASHGLSAEEV